MKYFFLAFLFVFQISCAQESETMPWEAHEFGHFEKTSLEALPKKTVQGLAAVLNDSRITRSILFFSTADFSPIYDTKSMFKGSRELFYISDIEEKVTRIAVSVRSQSTDPFPFITTSSDETRIEGVNLSTNEFYDLTFDFEKEGLVYELNTLQNITAQQQQNRVYSEILQQYRNSRNMSLPRTRLQQKRTISRAVYEQYMPGELTPSNVDSTYYYFSDNEANKVFFRSPYHEFILFDIKGRIHERLSTEKRRNNLIYNDNGQLSALRSIDPDDPSSSSLIFEYHYSPQGMVDSIFNYTKGKISQKEVFKFEVYQSNKNYLKVIVNKTIEKELTAENRKTYYTEIYFDKKMNWVKIVRSNGEANRRITYK